jgi:hypothetical protein
MAKLPAALLSKPPRERRRRAHVRRRAPAALRVGDRSSAARSNDSLIFSGEFCDWWHEVRPKFNVQRQARTASSPRRALRSTTPAARGGRTTLHRLTRTNGSVQSLRPAIGRRHTQPQFPPYACTGPRVRSGVPCTASDHTSRGPLSPAVGSSSRPARPVAHRPDVPMTKSVSHRGRLPLVRVDASQRAQRSRRCPRGY